MTPSCGPGGPVRLAVVHGAAMSAKAVRATT
jgi:hypothetical protein